MVKKKRLLILGAGGHGGVVADAAQCCGYSDIKFIDERWPELSQKIVWPVVAASLPAQLQDWQVIVAIGQNKVRLDLIRELMGNDVDLPTIIHPSATVSKHAVLGLGCFLAANAVIGAGARIGLGSIVNTSASVDHDCTLGNGVHISPGAHLAGSVTVGECSWIGIGAVVREGIVVGERTMVGAGAAVVAHVPDGAEVRGIPAR